MFISHYTIRNNRVQLSVVYAKTPGLVLFTYQDYRRTPCSVSGLNHASRQKVLYFALSLLFLLRFKPVRGLSDGARSLCCGDTLMHQLGPSNILVVLAKDSLVTVE